MLLGRESDRVLFVADSADTSTRELTLIEHSFEVDSGAGLDLRTTFCRRDLAVAAFSTTQVERDEARGGGRGHWDIGASEDVTVPNGQILFNVVYA